MSRMSIRRLAQQATSTATGQQGGAKNIVLVDGCRTPFCTSGSAFKDHMAHDLQRAAIAGLVERVGIAESEIDHLISGTVLQEPKTSNIAREASLGANLSDRIPSHTTTLACISSNAAMAQASNMIQSGNADVVIAGGVESMSDPPIRFSQKLRKKMFASTKIKSFGGKLGLLKGIGLKDLAPELPAIAEFSTGEIMGQSADRLASAFGVTRQEQDAFALRSHTKAQEAQDKGILEKDIVPVLAKGGFVYKDNGIKVSTPEKLASLRAAFIKPHGTVTAASSSFLTDGASACLLMSEEKALALGLKPKAYLRNYKFVAQDPKDQLLLGPAYAVGKVLERTGMSLKDFGVLEFHEAFAGQILACIRAMESETFAKTMMNKSAKIGDVDMTKVNTEGGSLSLGHPFGATGVRLAFTAANRLIREDQQFALIAACAAGGQGVAQVIERYPQ